MYRILSAAVLAAGIAIPAFASAQSTAAPRIGVIGGVNLAKVGGDDVDEAGTRTGLLAGVSLTKPLSGAFSLELNGLFSQKGAKDLEEGTNAALKLNYLEVPILLRYDVKTTGGVHPHFSGGVSLGYQTGCKISASDGGVSGEVSCSLLEGEDGTDVKKFDVGLVAGAGLNFALANNRMFTVGARYNYGLSDLFEDASVQNRAIQLYAGFSIPLR
ncbi:porin family protein [Gemmatimonas groenlandica]|uniref:PorT family protein n=1 Tax=Gemmatimonas groenlandica TaxID=2732249 RepID=A0A6M4IRB0_9BACT|nr:porin family protein [Gemmatimonas groenlandica]QJR36675.1 PorT family protein [Gemmatimonas groenlandica]